MNEHFKMATTAIPALFQQLMNSNPLTERGTAAQRGKPGIYIFFENGKPVHVGRTRNLENRMRSHVAKNHNSASFAFKRTRVALSKAATYKKAGSRAELVKDEIFRLEFHRQIDLVKGMEVRFIEVRDPIAQYLLELYAHLEYGLPLDEFDTH